MAENNVDHKIAVLVNEEVITSYDIIQRLKLTSLIQGININNQNNQLLLNNTVDELIQEKVKIEKINEYKIKVEDNEYLEYETNFLRRKNIEQSQFFLLLEKNNINYVEFKNLLLIDLSWGKLISGLFYRLTSVTDLEINEIISKNPSISSAQAENLVIQRQLDLQSSKLLRDIMNEATIEYR
tara:strand:- start:992 stop:1540 length:549 start_codon:yes stop_codon:yes gene_type:complete